MSSSLSIDSVFITDVSPRDGLQNQAVQIETAAKLALIEHLLRAGLRRIEAASFVSPMAVPRMADADILFPALPAHPDVRYSALIPNVRGLERAIAAGAKEVAVVLAATETMNQKNINMTLAQATQASVVALREARTQGIRTRAYVAVAIECPFEGKVDAGVVQELAHKMVAAGAQELIIADTIGAAAPSQIKALLTRLLTEIPVDSVAIHLHDTRGMGVANAWAALEAGVRRFDSSLGGIGGCPFAPGAAGNLATEDLVLMLNQSGMHTGLDLDCLYRGVEFAQTLLGQNLGGRSSAWFRRQVRA